MSRRAIGVSLPSTVISGPPPRSVRPWPWPWALSSRPWGAAARAGAGHMVDRRHDLLWRGQRRRRSPAVVPVVANADHAGVRRFVTVDHRIGIEKAQAIA